MSRFASGRSLLAAAAGLAVLVAAGWLATRFVGRDDRPQPAAPPADPPDIEAQVHAFCGAVCHAYPPPDTFPRWAWRTEVKQA